MSKMEWASEFNTDAADYVTPDVAMAGTAANGSKPATWSSSEIQQVFSHTTLSQVSSSNSSSSSGGATPSKSSSSRLSGGAVAGIAIAAAAIILIVIGALLWVRRSKRRSRAGHNPYMNDQNAYPMNYRGVGKNSPASQAPLIEIDGG